MAMPIYDTSLEGTELFTDTVCRLCLEDSQDNVNAFTNVSLTDSNQLCLQDVVWKLLGFWIRPEDGLPKMICPTCFHHVHTFHIFSTKVKETQIRLQNAVNNKLHQPRKSCYDMKLSESVLEKTKDQEIDSVGTFHSQASVLHSEPYEVLPEVNLQQNQDPWNFLSGESSNFTRLESASIVPSNVPERMVEVKVEIDPSVVDQLSSSDNLSSRISSKDENNSIVGVKSARQRTLRIKKKSTTSSPQNKVSKPSIKIKINVMPDEHLINEIFENDDNNSCSESESNSESDEQLKRTSSPTDRKKNWTERSKQRSKLTEQLADFYNFKCLECVEEQKFPTYHQLNLHSRKHHNIKGYVICCNQKLQDKNVIKSHMLKHLSPGIFQCQQCGKELANKESLENHLVKHLPEEKRPFKCATCARGFPSKGGLTAHEKSHLPEDERMRYVCDVCGKRFPYQTSLNSHKKYVHLNLRTVMCHICPKTFVDRASLNSHIHTHLTNERVQCSECGKWFKNQINLRAHMKTHEGLVFECPKCAKVFSTKHRLGEHIRGHTDARPHQCAICSKSFKVRAGLKTHMVQHTGEKPYQCPFCPRTFASSGNFSTHKKRMHSSQKSQSVNNCNSMTQISDINNTGNQLQPRTTNACNFDWVKLAP